MKIFIDSGDIAEIREAQAMGVAHPLPEPDQ